MPSLLTQTSIKIGKGVLHNTAIKTHRIESLTDNAGQFLIDIDSRETVLLNVVLEQVEDNELRMTSVSPMFIQNNKYLIVLRDSSNITIKQKKVIGKAYFL